MRLTLVLSALMAAAPAQADDFLCEEAWFVRNLAMDRAGLCFGSPLGQALFDNADCRGPTDLPTETIMLVEAVRALEAEWSCAVDSSAARLEWEPFFNYYRSLDTLPVPTPYESGCIGYRGPAVVLRAAPEPGAAVTGRILPGDHIGWHHEPAGGWDFVTTISGDEPGLAGWGWMESRGPMDCEMHAG